ncbi:hypothetical protein WS75_25720 [Burkholderia sp. FL-7-2-10-S1-D7]|nr:hypothetical protein WS75_25720 [Burkholderia sp. FL-7-2-10-S1-D7]
MIVRPREHWLRMLLVWNGSVLPTILPQLALTLAISLVAVWGGGRLLGEKVPLNPTPFTLLELNPELLPAEVTPSPAYRLT